MFEPPITNLKSAPHPGIASRAIGAFRLVVQWIPRKARLAVCFGAVVLIPLAIYTFLSNGHGDLNLVCRHNLKSAELTVTVDGKLAFTDQVSGTVTKRFGFLDKKVEGTLSKSLAVPFGKHIVRVSMKSTPDRFDQTRQIAVNLVSGMDTTVLITAQKGDLSLAYQGAPIAGAKENSPDHSSAFWSILVTAMGSVGSAAIGFWVQEFLRNRKTAFVQTPSSK